MRSLSNLDQLVGLLEKEYQNPDLGNKADPIDEIVFILLSEKTNEAKYLEAFDRLKLRFPVWDNLLTASTKDIEKCIRVAGMGKRRARLLRNLLDAICKRFGSVDLSALASMTPEVAEKELLRLPGIGHKAARCILLYCFGFSVLPVDIHTYRLAVRLGILSRRISYDLSHEELSRRIPENLRRAFHLNAVAHGRARCFARSPTCESCPLSKHCGVPKAIKPLPIEVRPKPLAIDLFAGAGGLSLGFQSAGFQVIQAVELDPHAASTYRQNHPQVDLLETDVRKITPASCLMRLGLRPGDVTILVGGPPCQGFSESNRLTRTLSNKRNHLYKEYLRFLRVIQPQWFVIENVAGLRTLKKGAILKRIIQGATQLGYSSQWAELNAADYGVPQFRRRIFIIGTRNGPLPKIPKAIHGPSRMPYVTVRQAIDDLPILSNGAAIDFLQYRKHEKLSGYQKLRRNGISRQAVIQGHLISRNNDKVIKRYKHIRAGDNWEAIPARLMKNYEDSSRCHTGIYHRLTWDKPAKVIGNFRKNMLIHPSQNRGLSIREAARLQSFPDDYVFVGSIGFQQQQVADAVPPLLAQAVAASILATDRRELEVPRKSQPFKKPRVATS